MWDCNLGGTCILQSSMPTSHGYHMGIIWVLHKYDIFCHTLPYMGVGIIFSWHGYGTYYDVMECAMVSMVTIWVSHVCQMVLCGVSHGFQMDITRYLGFTWYIGWGFVVQNESDMRVWHSITWGVAWYHMGVKICHIVPHGRSYEDHLVSHAWHRTITWYQKAVTKASWVTHGTLVWHKLKPKKISMSAPQCIALLEAK